MLKPKISPNRKTSSSNLESPMQIALKKKIMEQVVKTWREMKTEQIQAEKARLEKMRESKRGEKAATSSLTMQTDCNKGIESRNLVEEIQIEKRLQRIPLYNQQKDAWSPQPVKRATKKDFLRLMRNINENERKYDEPVSRYVQKKANRNFKTVEGGILKKPSIIDLNGTINYSPETTKNNFNN